MKGIYVLIIEIHQNIIETIGALGQQKFSKGTYAYVGSAQKTLEQRVKRHIRKEKKKFWHIDYLLDDKNVKIKKIFYKPAEKQEECNIAAQISEQGIPINGFGCSDCQCKSHLLKIENLKFLEEAMLPLNLEESLFQIHQSRL